MSWVDVVGWSIFLATAIAVGFALQYKKAP